MDIYLQKTVDAIKNSSKPSGRNVSRIVLTDDIMTKYGSDDPLTISYMIAHNLCSVPDCAFCTSNKVAFKSTTKGFARYCSVKCRLADYNKQANYDKSIARSSKIFDERKDFLNSAKEYYINNVCTMGEVAKKFSLSYYNVRKYFHDNGITKLGNQQYHRTQNFSEVNDPRLFDSSYLEECAANKKSLKEVASELNVSANTVRLYALKHNIIFDSGSRAEKEILEFLQTYDSNASKTRKIISPLEIDAFSEKYNLGIELHGEYWHSENRVSNRYHLDKQLKAEEKGIRLLQIFLHEWEAKSEVIKSMIRTNTNSSQRMFARNLKFIELDKNIARTFFDENHLQGWLKCKYVFGLVDQMGEVYSAISFGKSRFDQDCDYELLRFCNKLNHNVVGGFTKLMKNSEKILNFQSVITYSHRRLFTGKVYETFGFKHIRETKPGYFWYNKRTGDIKTRYKTQKHKLNTDLSEIEYMTNEGYLRIFDCGQNVYKYTKTT